MCSSNHTDESNCIMTGTLVALHSVGVPSSTPWHLFFQTIPIGTRLLSYLAIRPGCKIIARTP